MWWYVLVFLLTFGCVAHEDISEINPSNVDVNISYKPNVNATAYSSQEPDPCMKWWNLSYWRMHPPKGAVVEMGYGGEGEVEVYPSAESLRQLKELGADVVNLEIQYTWSMERPYRRDPAAMTYLREALNNIHEAGLCAIVSVRNGPGRNDMFSGYEEEDDILIADIYHDEEAQEAWLAMLRDTVREFDNYTFIIAWDPMVEPAPYEYFSLLDEDTANQRGYEWWNDFYPRCVRAIREIDPDRPVIIESSDWGSPYAFKHLKVMDGNIVYSPHNYWPMEYTHQPEEIEYTYPGKICFWDEDSQEDVCEYVDRERLNDVWKYVDAFQEEHDVVIFVSEWGGMRFIPGMPQYLSDQVELMDERGWGHTYYAWGYDPGWEVQAFQLACGSDLDNLEPSPDADTFRMIYESWNE